MLNHPLVGPAQIFLWFHRSVDRSTFRIILVNCILTTHHPFLKCYSAHSTLGHPATCPRWISFVKSCRMLADCRPSSPKDNDHVPWVRFVTLSASLLTFQVASWLIDTFSLPLRSHSIHVKFIIPMFHCELDPLVGVCMLRNGWADYNWISPQPLLVKPYRFT